MIEKGKDLFCSKNHNQPIQQVLLNHQISAFQRLQCASCIAELEGQFISISFEQAKTLIQQKQQQLSEALSESINRTQEKISIFKQQVDTLKFNIIQQFDYLIKNSEEWAIDLAEFQKSKGQYSILDEIEHLDESIQYQEEKLIFELNQFNYSYYKKLETMFQINDLFKNIVQTKEAIDDINYEGWVQSYQMPQQRIQVKQFNEKSTPYIAENCKNHQKEIIQIDIRKGIKKEDRLKCINCEKDKSVTVVQFGKMWDEYYHNRQQRINNKQSEQKKKLDKLKESLYLFIVDLAKIIGQTIVFLEEKRYLSQINIDTSQLINIAELLSQDDHISICYKDKKNEKNYEECLQKFENLSQYLNKTFEIFQFQQIKQTNDISIEQQPINTYSKISQIMVVDSIQEDCRVISFNHDGSIIAAACYKDIKIWKFQDGKLEKTLVNLQGHTSYILSLVFSKSRNWIASSGCDCTIRLWKDMGNNQWKSSETGKSHTHYIQCLLLTEREDQLISGSADNSIKIWKITFESNQLIYEYSLDKHQGQVYQISLNEAETTLVSCGGDKQIIIWGKNQNKKWEFQNTINKSVDELGKRICFINDKTIAWQQCYGYTHIFKLKNGKFIEKPELKIELKSLNSDGSCSFPFVFNKQKQLLILKHNKYVYIIKQQQNGQFKIECEPIDCQSKNNFGGLTNDGQYLAVWNDSTKEIRVHRLIYE